MSYSDVCKFEAQLMLALDKITACYCNGHMLLIHTPVPYKLLTRNLSNELVIIRLLGLLIYVHCLVWLGMKIVIRPSKYRYLMIQQHGGPTGCFVSQEGKELLRWSIITKRGVLHILLVRGRVVLLHEGQQGHSDLVAKGHGEEENGRSAKHLCCNLCLLFTTSCQNKSLIAHSS